MKLAYASAITIFAALGGYGQTPESGKPEFEVASIKAAPPAGFFHAPDSGTGGPGSTDPTAFHCASCTLSSLITKAFSLERYQFPGQQSLPGEAFVISAKIPEGTTPEQFHLMLQNLLKDRFGLAWHFDKKEMQGYHLILSKNGPKLTPSKEATVEPPPDSGVAHTHGPGGWNGAADRSGLTFFNGGARYRGDRQTTQELAQMLANQLSKPVDDRTGLTGKYDIRLSWGGETSHSANHPVGGGGFGAGTGHDHGGGAGGGSGSNPASGPDNASGPALFDALSTQLGLKLVPAAKSTASILVVDHFVKTPTAN